MGSTENRALRRAPKIQAPTVGPLSGLGNPARAENLEGDVWGALTIEHSVVRPWFKRLLLALSGARKASQSRDPRGRRLGSTANRAFRRAPMMHTPTAGLGHGNPARAETLEVEDRALRRAPMLQKPTVSPLLGLRIPARAETLEGDFLGALKLEHSLVRP